MDAGLPRRVGAQVKRGGIKDESGLAAVVVREAAFPEMPDKHRDAVLSPAQELCEVELVEVAAAFVLSPFQPALKHGEFPVYPQPILAVRRNPHHCTLRHAAQCNVLPETHPRIYGINFTRSGDNPPCGAFFLHGCRYGAGLMKTGAGNSSREHPGRNHK